MESLTNLLPGSRVVGHQAGAGAARRAQQPPPPLHPPWGDRQLTIKQIKRFNLTRTSYWRQKARWPRTQRTARAFTSMSKTLWYWPEIVFYASSCFLHCICQVSLERFLMSTHISCFESPHDKFFVYGTSALIYYVGALVKMCTLLYISIKPSAPKITRLMQVDLNMELLHWILLLFCSSDEIKVRVQYFKAIWIHFMSNVWLRAHFPANNFVIWWKISIFVTKKLIPRYSTTFQLPNHLDLQKMIKI